MGHHFSSSHSHGACCHTRTKMTGHDLPFLKLSGSPYEMGQQHGEKFGEQIRTLLDRQRKLLCLMAGDVANALTSARASAHVTRLLDKFLAETSYKEDIKKYKLDWLLEEVRGMADGAGIDAEELLALQFMDELWFHVRETSESLKKDTGSSSDVPGHCTAVGIAGNAERPAIVAQTMDLESIRDGCQVVLQIEGSEGRPDQLVFTCMGMVGLNGINSNGVSLVVTNLPQLNHAKQGLPVAFLIRGILAKSSFADAKAFALNSLHASGQSYTIGGGDGSVIQIEASSGTGHPVSPVIVKEFSPSSGGYQVHANHPLTSEDKTDGYTEAKDGGLDNSMARQQSVEATLRGRFDEEPNAGTDAVIEVVKRSLTKKPVCVHNTWGAPGAITFGACVYVSGEQPSMWLAAGPPDVNDYHRLSFGRHLGKFQSIAPIM